MRGFVNSLSPSRAPFPRFCQFLLLAVKVAESPLPWNAPRFSNQDCPFAKKHPSSETVRWLVTLVCRGSEAFDIDKTRLPAINAPSRAQTGDA